MDGRIKELRNREPKKSGSASYLAILEAAAGLFGQFPSRDITLRDILELSGVSNQTLYNYFPNGRDDIAILLYDRTQRLMVEDFQRHLAGVDFSGLRDETTVINRVSACLVGAVFGSMRAELPVQSALVEYLRDHHLLAIATHTEELEEALLQVLSQRIGHGFTKEKLPRVVRTSVCLAREMGAQALLDGDSDLDELESDVRRSVRSLLGTGLRDQDGPSAGHEFRSHATTPTAIVGAPISPLKRENILQRILKRKGRGSD
jgi:AcrR family transcriptional regulator